MTLAVCISDMCFVRFLLFLVFAFEKTAVRMKHQIAANTRQETCSCCGGSFSKSGLLKHFPICFSSAVRRFEEPLSLGACPRLSEQRRSPSASRRTPLPRSSTPLPRSSTPPLTFGNGPTPVTRSILRTSMPPVSAQRPTPAPLPVRAVDLHQQPAGPRDESRSTSASTDETLSPETVVSSTDHSPELLMRLVPRFCWRCGAAHVKTVTPKFCVACGAKVVLE